MTQVTIERELLERLVSGFEHVSGIARQWEPDHSSGKDRALWAKATEACADVVKVIQAAPAQTLLGACKTCGNEYLATRTDVHKDKRPFIYCDCCGAMADSKTWYLTHGTGPAQPVNQVLVDALKHIANDNWPDADLSAEEYAALVLAQAQQT